LRIEKSTEKLAIQWLVDLRVSELLTKGKKKKEKKEKERKRKRRFVQHQRTSAKIKIPSGERKREWPASVCTEQNHREISYSQWEFCEIRGMDN
jgi:copper homeostasis protein CutC